MNKRSENFLVRRQKIFQEYENVIAEFGPNAPGIAKKILYERVADKLGYAPEWIRKVIAEYLKEKK